MTEAEQFIKLWNESETLGDVASQLGIKPNTATKKASKLRLQGYELKTFYNRDSAYFARIGAIGGKRSTTGGFFKDRELARRAGSIGGRISKRGVVK